MKELLLQRDKEIALLVEKRESEREALVENIRTSTELQNKVISHFNEMTGKNKVQISIFSHNIVKTWIHLNFYSQIRKKTESMSTFNQNII